MPPRRSKRKATDAIDNAAANAEDNASSSTAAAAAVAAVASASTAGVSRQPGVAKKTKAKKKKKEKSKATTGAGKQKQPPPPVEEELTINLTQTSLLSNLLLQIQSLSNNKARCTAALQSLIDGHVAYSSMDGVDDEDWEQINNNKKNASKKASDFAPNLASFAASLSGEDVDLVNSGVSSAAAASTTSFKGKKRTSEKKGKSKGGGNDVASTVVATSATSGGEGEDGIHQGSNDAHLIMAVTQAINVLLSFLKKNNKSSSSSSADSNSTKPDANKTNQPKDDEEEDEQVDYQEAMKHASIILISLSHPLLTTLVNDRSMLETITKASRSSGSTSPTRGSPRTSTGDRSFFGVDSDDNEMSGSKSSARSSNSPTRGSGISPEKSSKGGSVESKRIIISHAKAIVGRALSSGVMGALYGMETLGTVALGAEELNGSDTTMDDEDANEEKRQQQDDTNKMSSNTIENTVLRRCLWTALMTLEASFQLTPNPKLLVTSSMSSSTGASGLRLSSTSGIPPSGGRIGGGSSDDGMDFDHLLAAMSGAAGKAHLTMGSDTISMWNVILSQILTDYRVEFQYTRNTPAALGTTTEVASGVGSESNTKQVENEHLAQICHVVTDSLFSDESESKLISLVLDEFDKKKEGDSMSTVEPPKKARRTTAATAARARKDTKQSKGSGELSYQGGNYSELSVLLSSRMENHITFDCHVSIRRWAVLAFGWLCNGQNKCLDMGTNMLMQCEGWGKIMEMSGLQNDSSLVADSKSTTTTKKKKLKESKLSLTSISAGLVNTGNNKQTPKIPGNVSLIIFISCVIDMIYDAGATGGLSPPSSGWMDEYVKAIVGITVSNEEGGESKPKTDEKKRQSAASKPAVEEVPTRRSSRKRSKTSKSASNNSAAASSNTAPSQPRNSQKSPSLWIRRDVRDECATLTKQLMEAHSKCLNDSFKEHKAQGEMILVNDDENFQSSPSRRRASYSSSLNKNEITSCFYPFMHRTLDTLGRIVASNSIYASIDGKSKIVSIGSAVTLACFWREHVLRSDASNDGAAVFDAKLLSLAISQLSECLEGFMSGSGNKRTNTGAATSSVSASISELESSTSATALPQSVQKTYHLNEILDISMRNAKPASTTSTNATSSSNNTPSSYGGAFPISASQGRQTANNSFNSSSSLSNSAESLSLFVRALVNPPSESDTTSNAHHHAMSSLLQSLLAIVSICYNFSPEMHSQEMGGVPSPPTSKKKSSSSSKKKKRKTSELTDVLAVGMPSSSQGEEVHPRKTFTRCVLASDALQSLIQALAIPSSSSASVGDTASKAALSIHSHFRTCLSTANILEFIELGYSLEQKLVCPRLKLVSNEYTTASTVNATDTAITKSVSTAIRDGPAYTGSYNASSSSSSKLSNMLEISKMFELWERQLWAFHVQCARILGCGGFITKQSNVSISPLSCLSSTDSRLLVFRAIIAAEKKESGGKKNDKSDKDRWPLSLPAIQSALIASMILNSQQGGQIPELHLLTDSFLNSLEEYINNLSTVHETLNLHSRPTLTNSDNVLLSLRDARLFALALTKLPQDNQRSMLSRLMNILHKVNSANKISGYASTFVARTLTVCSSLVDAVACPDLQKLLAKEVEKTNYCIPHLEPQSEPTIFSKEMYQSLFANWSSPSVPAANISTTSIILENGAGENRDQLFKLMTSTIFSALNMGVSTCTSDDGCQLLFSAWNAAGKLPSWTASSWQGPAKAQEVKNLTEMERLIRLREDMCEIYCLLMNTESMRQALAGQAETLLMRITLSKSSDYSNQPNVALFGAVDSTIEMLKYLTTNFDMVNSLSTSPSTFAYYEALSLYASFLISMFTRPGSNDTSLVHRLQKITASSSAAVTRYSNDSDDLDSYGTSAGGHTSTSGAGGSIVRINALNRLHDTCLSLGAAPCYPDWLDVNCKFQGGISASMAIIRAESMLSSLTSFGLSVWQQYFEAMKGLLSALDIDSSSMQEDDDGNGLSKADRYSVALQLFYAQQQHPTELSDSFFTQISSLCLGEGAGSLFKLLVNSISNEDQKNLQGAPFVTTSSQRIVGANYFTSQHDQTMGEHRANSQWETLLAEVLQGISFSVSPATITNALSEKQKDVSVSSRQQIDDALTLYHHWRRVLNGVINAMVPAAALLRFGINDGKGRKVHPQYNGSPFDTTSGSSSISSRLYSEQSAVSITIQRSLSFLSCVAAYSWTDEDVRLTSRAVSNHLLDDENGIDDWIQMYSMKILCSAMEGVVNIVANEKKKKKEKAPPESSPSDASAALLIDTSLTLFAECPEDYDESDLPIISIDDTADTDKRNTLLSCLGMKNKKTTKLIGTRSDSEIMSLLGKFDSEKMDPLSKNSCDDWKSMKDSVPKLLLKLLCSNEKVDRVRIFITELLIDLMDTEFEKHKEEMAVRDEKSSTTTSDSSDSVCTLFATSFDALSKDDILVLVKDLSYSSPESADTFDEKKLLSDRLANLISCLICSSESSSTKSEGNAGKLILDEMLSSISICAGSFHHITMVCLLGARFGALNDIGAAIVSLLESEKAKQGDDADNNKDNSARKYVDSAKDFFEFAASLDHLANQETTSSVGSATTNNLLKAEGSMASQRGDICGSFVTLRNGEKIGRSCSFVDTGEGFTEQHWYNCYTCGLLWDKGCCSLCARVCHKGHDIGYSRKSSFFCDCGAEVATAIEQNRTPCKCLTPVSADVIREAFGDNSPLGCTDTETLESLKEFHHNHLDNIFAERMIQKFPLECKNSLKSLAEEASKSEWMDSLVAFFNEHYQNTTPSSSLDFSKVFNDADSSTSQTTENNPNIEDRAGKVLALNRLTNTSILAVRAAKSSALQSRAVLSSSGTGSSHSIRKAKNEIHVQAITSDSRGRLYIAESSSVLFCSAIPCVNTRNVDHPTASHLSRSQLNILGSGSIQFAINGMAICGENNRHLLVWGASKACVAVVSKNFDSFERIIELKLNLEPSETHEYLVKCEWLPNTEFHIVAVCGTVVHVFDLKKTDIGVCNATTHYALAYEDVLIRSATLVGALPVDDGSFVETKLALLLDTGRIYFITIAIDEEGNLEDHGESYIEVGQGVQFPTSGMRRYVGGEPVSSGSTSSTLGEGIYLTYLKQSKLLLYQSSSSCCLALLLDDDGGSICGSFELLPNVISTDILGSQCVAGPFTHWQELGTVERASSLGTKEIFYRVTCVAKSTRTKQPRTLVLEFNENSVSVKELSWPAGSSSGLGFISSFNYVGSCTFSCPYLVGGKAHEGCVNKDTSVHERAFMALLSSSGSLLFWGEDCNQGRTSYYPHSTQFKAQAAIGVFEKLINVNELDALVFGGDFVQNDDPQTIKRKLSLNNSDYAISPSSSCTLTCRLDLSSKSTMHNSKYQAKDLAIVAVRVLVGSVPDLIPREIVIMGRPVKLKRNVKRWYDFPLTDEEALLVLRNGFVTILISSCHDHTGNTPIIDSVECYARPRSELAYLIAELKDKKSKDTLPLLTTPVQEKPSSEVLEPCMKTLTFLTQVIGGQNKKDFLSTGAKDTISRIIQQTALESSVELKGGGIRYQTIEFLKKAEENQAKQEYVIDEATLRGLVEILQSLDKHIRSEFASVDYVTTKQEVKINHAIEILLHILHSAITIARARGNSYKDIITKMISDNTSKASLALEGKKTLDYLLYLKDMKGANVKLAQPVKFVSELMILEMACADSSATGFAQFDTIAQYLTSDLTEVVKACCSSVSAAIGGGDKNDSGNSRVANNKGALVPSGESGIVTYQCDSCLVFPITESRYTLGGEIDLDLCKECYNSGTAYARSHAHDSTVPVIINDETLTVENEPMTCEQIWDMMRKPIAASSLEQAENAKKVYGASLLKTGSKTSLKTIPESQSLGTSSTKEDIEIVKAEGFRSQIFTQLLSLITKSFNADNNTVSISSYLLQLIINLAIGTMCTEEIKCANAKEMAIAFSEHLPTLVDTSLSNDAGFERLNDKLVICLRTLAGLVLQKQNVYTGPPLVAVTAMDDKEDTRSHHHHQHHHHHHKDKTDPRFICEVHGAPAVRRRCSHGIHKDRRFYVCGLEKNQRCNYFKWSDEIPDSAEPPSETQPQDEDQLTNDAKNISIPLQKELQQIFSKNSLQEKFCRLISDQFEKNQAVASPSTDVTQQYSAVSTIFPSAKSESEKLQDIEDGVYKSSDKLRKTRTTSLELECSDDHLFSDVGTKESFLSSSLDLFSLLAPKRKETFTDATSWTSDWFPILCEIISTAASVTLRQLAKSMLLKLTGGRHDVYIRVRDHYVFGFQFRKLLQRSQDILESALMAREQARQCGPSWREEEVMFQSLPACGLMGVEDLISEDWYASSTEESISTVLDELISAAARGVGSSKTRSSNSSWRNFCGLYEMAFFNRKATSSSDKKSGEDLDMLEQIYRRSPIVSLLWLSSCLRGSNQVKALSLTDIALEDITSSSTVKFQDDTIEDDFFIGGNRILNSSHPSQPEHLLSFTVDDLLAFIKQFVVNGRAKDVRAVSSNVARKLAHGYSQTDKNRLFTCLVLGPYQQIGTLGAASGAFSDLLKGYVQGFGSELNLSNISSCVAAAFMSQMTVLNHYYGQNQGLMGKQETDLGGPSCNLSNCVNCQKQPLKMKNSKTTTAPYLTEQVRPYQRGRIEASTAAEVSSEFSIYNQLKFRVALAEVHVTVSDPRGRLVKTIGVYFSPRQVSDASVLKTTKYTHLWQRCGTISLARGATEATCKLKHPAIVANMKFTYEDFYEKSSNKRAADGSFILYCPRCTRQVHNAHGVCGNCGEVAFQCRKCRHINYDRLDAFLCVECGYCTAGGFAFELTAGIALNAIAILDEDGFQRSMTMLSIASKRQTDLRNSLKKKVTAAIKQQRKIRGDKVENLDEMELYGPHLQRALQGHMPKAEGMDDDESSKKLSGSSRSKGSSSLAARESSSSSRARSLLSLARSLRQDGGDSLGSRGDMLRGLLSAAGGSGGSGGSSDLLDDADILSALGASSSSNDPLSRIVANINSRTGRDEGGGRGTRATSSGAGGGGGGGGGGGEGKSDKSKLSPIEERTRLYTQMREAERECYELNRRIDAWNRLNKDCLLGSSASALTTRPFAFTPSTCSVCSMQMAYQILSLLHAIYITNISQSEHTVTVDLLRFLLKEPESLTPKLKDIKRRVIITLASTSEVASKMIIAELKSRLAAVQDVTSAEILGRIVELDFKSVNDYIDLAVSTLSSMGTG